jgi:hypothetical protein
MTSHGAAPSGRASSARLAFFDPARSKTRILLRQQWDLTHRDHAASLSGNADAAGSVEPGARTSA